MAIAEIKKTLESKMDHSLDSFKKQPHPYPYRACQPGPAGHGAGGLLRFHAAHQPGGQFVLAGFPHHRHSTLGKGMSAKIEKAIRDSDLGLNPSSMGELIRVPMPAMTEERRKELTKVVRGEGESAKVAIRNIRRDANDAVKKLVKDKLASEDEQKRSEADIQKTTDRHIADVDRLVAAKEQDIMAV